MALISQARTNLAPPGSDKRESLCLFYVAYFAWLCPELAPRRRLRAAPNRDHFCGGSISTALTARLSLPVFPDYF
jgi:hypothetical protein